MSLKEWSAGEQVDAIDLNSNFSTVSPLILKEAGFDINVGDPVDIYTDGKIYPANSLNNTSKFVGFSIENITKGNTGLFRATGLEENQSSLTIGSFYYIQDATATVADQSQTSADQSQGVPNTETRYQSFTTGGGITDIFRVRIEYTKIGSSETWTLRLREGEGTGGSLLATKAVSTVTGGGTAFLDFYFDIPIELSASTQYSITIQASTGNITSWRQKGATNPYAGGRADSGASDDYYFITYPIETIGQIGTSVGTNTTRCGLAIDTTDLIIFNDQD